MLYVSVLMLFRYGYLGYSEGYAPLFPEKC